MSGSQIFTIGTALRRAEDGGIPVEVLVDGHWLSGSVAGLDGEGAVLVAPDETQCVVRTQSITVVRILSGEARESSRPNHGAQERWSQQAYAEPAEVPSDVETEAWAMPSGAASVVTQPHPDEAAVVAATTLVVDTEDLPDPVVLALPTGSPVDPEPLTVDDAAGPAVVGPKPVPGAVAVAVAVEPEAVDPEPGPAPEPQPVVPDLRQRLMAAAGTEPVAESAPAPEPVPVGVEPPSAEPVVDPEPPSAEPEPKPEPDEEWRHLLTALQVEAGAAAPPAETKGRRRPGRLLAR
jgi:hypothetical protein